jgi:hypothetical protein
MYELKPILDDRALYLIQTYFAPEEDAYNCHCARLMVFLGLDNETGTFLLPVGGVHIFDEICRISWGYTPRHTTTFNGIKYRYSVKEFWDATCEGAQQEALMALDEIRRTLTTCCG